MVKAMRLYRSVRDKKLSGLCGGLAEIFNVDVTVLRLIVLLAMFFSGGAVILIYILASIVVPKETEVFGPGGYNSYHYQGDHRHRHHSHHRQYNDHRYEEPKAEASSIDDMMEDLEKKAMWNEIEQLRAKLAEFEKKKGDN